jgi:hypothetical protein
MAKMSAAIGTGNFSPSAIGIQGSFYRPFYFIIKTWPSAMGVKFIR